MNRGSLFLGLAFRLPARFGGVDPFKKSMEEVATGEGRQPSVRGLVHDQPPTPIEKVTISAMMIATKVATSRRVRTTGLYDGASTVSPHL
jgi:hypothetical protein